MLRSGVLIFLLHVSINFELFLAFACFGRHANFGASWVGKLNKVPANKLVSVVWEVPRKPDPFLVESCWMILLSGSDANRRWRAEDRGYQTQTLLHGEFPHPA